jgi:hypothetical protein
MHLLEVDMWFGKDQQNPSVVTRLLLIEEAISSLKTIKWLLVGAVATALFNILSTHIKF